MRALLLLAVAAVCVAEPVPLLVFVGQAPEPWRIAAQAQGWEFAPVQEVIPGDATMERIEAAVVEAAKRREIDPSRTYIVGAGASTSAALYAVSRRPDLWAAAAVVGGNATAAIETNRLFGANAQLIPILWAVSTEDEPALAVQKVKLTAQGFDIEMRTAPTNMAQLFEWLAGHKNYPYPPKVDCETGSTIFTRCYWIAITGFDPTARNDVLQSSRVVPGSGAYLALGGFGFDLDAPGPGVLISWLPPKYSGSLKLSDRILSVGGRPIKDARDYVAFMSREQTERSLGVVIERGKEHLRLETRILLPKREENLTARVRGEFLSDSREMLLITRGVAALHVDVPSFWVGCTINWNGNEAGRPDAPGCWLLTAGAPARKCQ
jgi:hypothetical protein